MADREPAPVTRSLAEPPSRRAVVAGIAALVSAAFTKATDVAEAQDGAPLVLGMPNDATRTTALTQPGSPQSGPALRIASPGGRAAEVLGGGDGNAGQDPGVSLVVAGGPRSATVSVTLTALPAPGAVIAFADVGPGVWGMHGPESAARMYQPGPSPAPFPWFDGKFAIGGFSDQDVGIAGLSGPESIAIAATLSALDISSGLVGVMAGCDTAPCPNWDAITLTAEGRTGVLGVATGDVGVRGIATDPGGVGVNAVNLAGGPALRVDGAAIFATSGSGTFPVGVFDYTVANTSVTAKSHVTVTFTGDAKKAVYWIERLPGTGFVIHSNKKYKLAGVPFTYLIVEAP